MVDNIELSAGSGGAVVKTDDDGVAHWQYVKLAFGPDNTQTRVTTTVPLPVDLRAINASISLASPVTLSSSYTVIIGSGTVTANLGAVDNAVLDAIAASVANSAASVSLSSSYTVVLGASSAAIGKLAANSGVDIGDVDVTSLVPGTGATALGKAIDSAAGATDTGVAVLAVRDDALSALTPIEGDYVPLRVSSTGALHVTGGGGGTQYNVDDAAGATDTGNVLLAVRDDALTTLTPIDGDYVALRVNSTGALHVTGGGGGTEYAVDDALGATPTGGVVLAKRDDTLSALTPVEGDAVELRVDSTGSLWTREENKIDGGNSTTTPLGISAAFTGTGVDCSGYAAITCTLYADVASATDGMTFQFSTDNSNWDDTYSFTMAAGSARRFQFPVTAQYFRIVYTNGGTGQAAFRVQTILHSKPVGSSVHRIQENVSADRSATLVKSALVAQINGSGDFVPIQSTASGILKVGGGVTVDAAVSLSSSYTVVIASGTVTANLGATDNAVLDAIAASVADSAASVSLSSSYTVVIATALPAGTNAIGKLAANSGVDIGDVDVTSVVPGTGATALGKAIDSAAGATDTGVATLAVRDDALSALTPIEGDYVPLRLDANGALWVIPSGTVTVDGSGVTQPVSGTVTANLSATDNAVLDSIDTAVTNMATSVSLSSSYSVAISGNVTVVGGAAHDAAVSGNPVLQGLEARTSFPTAVANGDAVRAMADDAGRQVVVMSSPRDLVTDAHFTSLSASTTQTLLAAGGAGVFLDLALLTLSNRSSTVADVVIYDGLVGGTERFRFELAADGGGAIIPFNVPFKQGTANNGWAIKSTELDVSVTVQAVQNQ